MCTYERADFRITPFGGSSRDRTRYSDGRPGGAGGCFRGGHYRVGALSEESRDPFAVKIKNQAEALLREHFPAATTILLSNGVPIETVSRLLGHTNIKTTQIYAKITNQKISQDMAELSAKLENMEKSISNAI